jgi:hypothetical protein
MIKSNMMSSSQPKTPDSKKAGAGKKNVPGKGSKSGGGKAILNLFYMLLFAIMAAIAYLEIFGVPTFLRGVIPQQIISILGLSEESSATQALREAGAPKLTASGRRPSDPSIPANGSVEEVVRTMRPEVYFKDKILSDYKEQPISNRISYQKQAFHIMLSTFYNGTPDGIGYLDLAYQAPNFFFARAIALDSRTRTSYMDNLKVRVVDLTMTDSITGADGNIEFVVYGGIQQPKFDELKQTKLVSPSKINSEILALRNLAVLNHVNLSGIEKPMEEKVGSYRRIILNVSTDADYPSLLNFADALQKSDISFGVQQFISRPAGPERMRSSLEFVLYASAK